MGTNIEPSIDNKHQLTVDISNDESSNPISSMENEHGQQATSLPLSAIRLKQAMDEANLTQTELADAIEVLQPTISRILDGTTKRSRYLPMIAKVLNKNANWLAGIEPSDKDNITVNKNLLDINNHLFIIVPEYKNKVDHQQKNINEGIFSDNFTLVTMHHIPSAIDSTGLRFICEASRAMTPIIRSGATVTFDSHDTNVTRGDISVIEFGANICARFLFSQPNGDILIRAKEADFPDYTVSKDEENFKILGRVVLVTNTF